MQKTQNSFGGKDIGIVVLVLGLLYILATHIVATSLTFLFFVIILLVAAYFILPFLLPILGLTYLFRR